VRNVASPGYPALRVRSAKIVFVRTPNCAGTASWILQKNAASRVCNAGWAKLVSDASVSGVPSAGTIRWNRANNAASRGFTAEKEKVATSACARSRLYAATEPQTWVKIAVSRVYPALPAVFANNAFALGHVAATAKWISEKNVESIRLHRVLRGPSALAVSANP